MMAAAQMDRRTTMPNGVTVRSLATLASALTNVSVRDILGPSRAKAHVYVRFAVARAARRRGRTYGSIGRVFGRDHTTMIHAARRAEQLIATNPEFARLCAALEAMA